MRSATLGSLPFAVRSPIAQLAEHSTVNRRVIGSSPIGGANTGRTLVVSTAPGPAGLRQIRDEGRLIGARLKVRGTDLGW